MKNTQKSEVRGGKKKRGKGGTSELLRRGEGWEMREEKEGRMMEDEEEEEDEERGVLKRGEGGGPEYVEEKHVG